jgi:hypothetical protein
MSISALETDILAKDGSGMVKGGVAVEDIATVLFGIASIILANIFSPRVGTRSRRENTICSR